jgi:GR25 family glycosyltransferase involved in LPS biosynthesis
MKAFVIALVDQPYEPLTRSIEETESPLELHWLPATTPLTIKDDRKAFPNFAWTWPMLSSQDGLDMKTGLYKFVYQAQDQGKKVACSLSHMRAWQKCVDLDEPIVIFEADAVITRKLDFSELDGHKLVGLNDPRGATRRSDTFHNIASSYLGVQGVPTVNRADENPVPQGIAGNSAYYIEPEGAKLLLKGADEYGMWPNDAFMCKELFPWIRIVYPYYTKVRPTVSTTTR